MGQVTKSVLSVLDEYYTFYSKSQCKNCSFLIDGHCDMTCEKHPKGFPSDLWNNKKKCPDRKENTANV